MLKPSQKCQNCRRFSPEIETEILAWFQRRKWVESEEILNYSNDQRQNFSISNHTYLIADLQLFCHGRSCTKEFQFLRRKPAIVSEFFCFLSSSEVLTSIWVWALWRDLQNVWLMEWSLDQVLMDTSQLHTHARPKLHKFNLIIDRNYIPRSGSFCVALKLTQFTPDLIRKRARLEEARKNKLNCVNVFLAQKFFWSW